MTLLFVALMAAAVFFITGFLTAMIIAWFRAQETAGTIKDLRRANQELKNRILGAELESRQLVPTSRTMWDD